jgi:hypothetical protein
MREFERATALRLAPTPTRIIAPAHQRWSFLDRLRKPKASARQVISVDEDGEVTIRPAEPLRS